MVGHACPTFRKASAQPDVRERDHDEVVHGDTGPEEADIDRVGLSYMLMGDVRQGQGATLAQDGQRMVLYRPAYHGRAAGFSQGRAPGHQSGISPIPALYNALQFPVQS